MVINALPGGAGRTITMGFEPSGADEYRLPEFGEKGTV